MHCPRFDAPPPPTPPWHRLCHDEWLLCAVLAFFEDDSDDVHWLWLLALDDGLTTLRARLEQHCSVSVPHAQRLAMAHSLWSALRKLLCGVNSSKRQNHVRGREDKIEAELTRLGLSPHEDRRAVLSTALALTHTPPESTCCPLCGRDRLHRCPGGFERRVSPNNQLHFCNTMDAFAMYAATRDGRLESVVWLHYVACYDQELALVLAGRNGHFRIVQWLLDHAHPKTITIDFRVDDEPALGLTCWRATPSSQHYAMGEEHGMDQMYDTYPCVYLAAKRGDFDALQRLYALPKFCECFTKALPGYAVLSGRLDVLEFLFELCPAIFTNSTALWGALRDGQFEIAQWLVAHGCGSVDDTWYVRPAIMNGRVDVLEWMLCIATDPKALQREMIDRSIECTSHVTLEWLVREHGLRLTTSAHANEAISRGDTALAKWIIACCTARRTIRNGPLLLETAIEKNNLGLVQWLVEEFEVWSRSALPLASAAYNVDVLAYIYEVSEARPELPRPRAAIKPIQRLEPHNCAIFEWLLDKGFQSGVLESGALDPVLSIERNYASSKRQFETCTRMFRPDTMRRYRNTICRIIHEYDVEYIRRVQWLPMWAAQHGSLDALKRLCEIDDGNKFTRKRFDKLILETARVSVVKWLLEQDPRLFSTLVVRWAVTHGKRGVLKWLFQSFLPSHIQCLNTGGSLLRKCVRTALWHAASSRGGGRCKSLLSVMKAWTPLASDRAVWYGIDQSVG